MVRISPTISALQLKELLQTFVSLGHHPDDSVEEKLRKSSLMVMAGPFAFAGLLWGLMYFAKGLTIPGLIPFCYGLLSLSSMALFVKTKKYRFFRTSQLVLILLLPFALQISLGGFVPGSAVIFWATITPAGALVFQGKKYAFYWYLAFLVLLFIAFFINDRLPAYIDHELEDSFITALFLMNIIGVSALVFMIQYYFVEKQTELKEAIEGKNEELEEQSKKLKELDELKSRFFANISHEFRTPLTLILGLVNRQIASPDSVPELKDTQTIKRNSERLLQLINQLLDLSKLESGELTLQTQEADILLFSKNLLAQFESFAEDKQISLRFNGLPISETHTDPEIVLYFDHEKLQKVWTNLLSNAVKFTPVAGEIAVNIHISKEKPDFVKLEIANTGPGIPPNKLPYVFDRFYQVDGASNRAYEGTGIGLALVKELVELHHGQVEVRSQEGSTAFSVYMPMGENYLQAGEKLISKPEILPQISPYVEQYEKKKTGIDASPKKGDQLEILLVEDNRDLRVFIKEILEKKYLVTEAVDGQDGLEKAQAMIPDLIISDVMMPGMDGYEMCRHIKTNKHTNHIPLILLTAKAARENKLEGLELGADDYLVKPFDQEELLIRIKNLISLRTKLQEKYQQEVWLKPKEVQVSSVHQKFLEDIKQVVEREIDNDQFGVEDLGREIGMSRSQIHRKLKALTDQSASNFIRNYRLHRAAELLTKEAGNITEIAYQVGFSSQSYFSSCFQELFACSPSEYKERVKG